MTYGDRVTLADGRRGTVTFVRGDDVIRFVPEDQSWQRWEWVALADVLTENREAA